MGLVTLLGFLLQVVAAPGGGQVANISWLDVPRCRHVSKDDHYLIFFIWTQLSPFLQQQACMIPVQIFANKGPVPESLCRLAVIWEAAVVCVSAPGLAFALYTFHLATDSTHPFDFEKLCCPCICLRRLFTSRPFCLEKLSHTLEQNEINSAPLSYAHYCYPFSAFWLAPRCLEMLKPSLPVRTWVCLLLFGEELSCDFFFLLIASSVSDICRAPTPAFLYLMGGFPQMQETAAEWAGSWIFMEVI